MGWQDAPLEKEAQATPAWQSAPIADEETAKQDNKPNRSFINELGHQAGLTGRDIIEGAAGTAGIFSDPLGYVINKATGLPTNQPMSVTGEHIANSLGLPKPENATERVVNDTAKLLVGTGGFVKGASTLANKVASPVAQKSLQMIASRPDLQAGSAIGSGVAGGTAKEGGANPTTQFLSSLAGGLSIPIAQNTIQNVVNSSREAISNFVNSKNLDNGIIEIIKKSGINLDNASNSVKQSIVKDVKETLNSGKELNSDALRRLVDYRTVGATPMRSNLTLNPAEVTSDRNLAKLSANSRDPVSQQLANNQRNNDLQLVSKLNELGANTADDAVTAGKQVIEALGVKDANAKNSIGKLYSQARETSGRSAQLDPSHFTQTANNLLDDALLGGKLPSDVRNVMNSMAQGKTPLTVDVAEQYKTSIAALQRASNDPAERLALGKVRQALEETPLLDGQGQQAIDAFNKARSAHKQYMQLVEKNPALQAVRDGIEPDKFVNTFILSGGNKSNISDVAALKDSLKNNPEATQAIRNQILLHLKEKALGGKADEVANFSPSNFNSAMSKIGDMKLSMFLNKEDINMLKTIGRVGSYEKFQPTGSAVNNSNTASAVASIIDRIVNSPIMRKIPIAGEYVANTAQDMKAKQVMNATKAIALPSKKEAIPSQVMLAPALYGSSNSTE
jgi:hypothetical protein